jgi:hypothetical protein
MLRYNLIQARGGDFSLGAEGAAMEGEGKDVIQLKIKRGTVSIILPTDVPDARVNQDEWFSRHACLELELEDGTCISGWVRGGESHLETD